MILTRKKLFYSRLKNKNKPQHRKKDPFWPGLFGIQPYEQAHASFDKP
jgi:hypothetical protein